MHQSWIHRTFLFSPLRCAQKQQNFVKLVTNTNLPSNPLKHPHTMHPPPPIILSKILIYLDAETTGITLSTLNKEWNAALLPYVWGEPQFGEVPLNPFTKFLQTLSHHGSVLGHRVKQLRHLGKVKLNMYSRFPDNWLAIILKNCVYLQTLDLSSSEYLCDESVDLVKKSIQVSSLKVLKLSNCPNLSIRGIGVLLSMFDSLEELDLSRNRTIDDAVAGFIPFSVEKLDISCCSYITDNFVVGLLTPSMHWLERNGKDAKLTKTPLLHRPLKWLSLNHCLSITDNTVLVISGHPIPQPGTSSSHSTTSSPLFNTVTLTHFYLKHTQITTRGLHILASFKAGTLQTLDISDCHQLQLDLPSFRAIAFNFTESLQTLSLSYPQFHKLFINAPQGLIDTLTRLKQLREITFYQVNSETPCNVFWELGERCSDSLKVIRVYRMSWVEDYMRGIYTDLGESYSRVDEVFVGNFNRAFKGRVRMEVVLVRDSVDEY